MQLRALIRSPLILRPTKFDLLQEGKSFHTQDVQDTNWVFSSQQQQCQHITNYNASSLHPPPSTDAKEVEENVIDLLKVGWTSYKQNATKVAGEFEFSHDDNEATILSWHCKLFLRLDNEKKEDKKKKHCRHCGDRDGTCRFCKGLYAWSFTARLCTLVMPPSTATERVFYLRNNLHSDQQTYTLLDSIFLTLFLSCKNRKVIVPKVNVNCANAGEDSA